MSTKNHKPMSTTERAFWREAFLAARVYRAPAHSVAEIVKARADFADAAVQEYRKRVTWRQS